MTEPAAESSLAEQSTPVFSIVLVAYGSREVTERCLVSIDRAIGNSLGKDVELVLVDNASADDTPALFDSWRERAEVVTLNPNRNYPGGANAGAAVARGEILLFLNNDTVVEPGALQALASQARQPGVGAAGLRLLYLDGTLQHAGVAMIRVPSGHVVPHHLFHHQDGQLAAARVSYELDAVTGACMAIGRDLFHELGGYDEGYVNGWEDVDLCLRVLAAGRRIVYRGDLWLWHAEGQTRGQVHGTDANADRFYRRWGELLESDEQMAARVFGGRLPHPRPVAAVGEPASLALTGAITGISGASSEARGLLAAFRAAGLSAAAVESVPEMLHADLENLEEQDTWSALARQPSPEATHIHVPCGLRSPANAILRLAHMPRGVACEAIGVWTASPSLSDELIAAGMAPERIAWLAPCVPTGPAGPGGEGILGLLPGHDLDRSAAALDALAVFRSERLRILPSIASEPLLALIAATLPSAEVLAPCPSDAGLRRLAGGADVVLCVDPDDIFQRRGLVAAGAGAATITAAGGPADAVLAEHTVAFDAPRAAQLRTALERALGLAGEREKRASAVREHCSEQACGERITALLTSSPLAIASPLGPP